MSAYPPSPLLKLHSLPANNTISSLAAGLAIAHQAYDASRSSPSRPTCILVIVQDAEHNIFDQRHLEYELQDNHSIPVFRLPFSRTLDGTEVAQTERRQLIYRPPHSPSTPFEVAVLYYRAGYSPEEYTSPTAWAARLHLERSGAIKCPDILTHLAGSKKIQQVLATPSSPHLDRFLPNPTDAERIRKTFTNIYPLDDSPAGLEARKLALDPTSAHRYVLKPQREGGGNNIYRDAIPAFLQSLSETQWKGYILMEIIEPPTVRNTILRNGQLQTGEVIGELGVYGVCLWDRRDNQHSGRVLHNSEAGHLLRTKGSQSEEGGVAAGFGCVDSCLLVDG